MKRDSLARRCPLRSPFSPVPFTYSPSPSKLKTGKTVADMAIKKRVTTLVLFRKQANREAQLRSANP